VVEFTKFHFFQYYEKMSQLLAAQTGHMYAQFLQPYMFLVRLITFGEDTKVFDNLILIKIV
jgi:hypothetical protein